MTSRYDQPEELTEQVLLCYSRPSAAGGPLLSGLMTMALLVHVGAVLGAADPILPGAPAPEPLPEWAHAAGVDQYGHWADFVLGGHTERMRWIVPGTFSMGSPITEVGREVEEAPHQVTISHGFWMAEHLCSRQLWFVCMGNEPGGLYDPGQRKGSDDLMDCLTWTMVDKFLTVVNRKTQDAGFSLPTEAQWEYACRAGSQGPYNGPALDAIGWYGDNSGDRTHPAGQKAPNAWGLYDMHGNLSQWCSDWYAGYPTGPVTDPVGPATGTERVTRGGNWAAAASACRSASRSRCSTTFGNNIQGFRLCIQPHLDGAGQVVAATAPPAPLPVSPLTRLPPSGKPDWASATGSDATGPWADVTIAGIAQRMRWIPPGSFIMGSPFKEEGHRDREALHAVTLTAGFWLADSTCTQELWIAVMGDNPSEFTGDLQRPVDKVTWPALQLFLSKANERVCGAGISVPYEAQWEYACRAGTTGAFSGPSLDALGWHKDNSGGVTHRVRGKVPNAWGMYDMHGNVYEWCADCYADYPSGAAIDPIGAASRWHVVRGGSIQEIPLLCRSARRDGLADEKDDVRLQGFRLAIPVPVAHGPSLTALAAAEAGAIAPRPAWADAVGRDDHGQWADMVVHGVSQRMRWIIPGRFMMGSSQEEQEAMIRRGAPDELADEVAHLVTLTSAYWLADAACSQEMWQAIMGSNPSFFKDDPKRPVETVTWDEVQEFVIKLNGQVRGGGLSLPTEAQREYACRAGTKGAYAGMNLCQIGWYLENSASQVHAARQKEPNAWGLFDMQGNLSEWCSDWYGEFTDEAATDPAGPDSGTYRVRRGGSWIDPAALCRSAYRAGLAPGRTGNNIGFRLCAKPSAPAAPVAASPEGVPAVHGPESAAQPNGPDAASLVPWASTTGRDQYGRWADVIVAGVLQRFRLIPPGMFTMGCDNDEVHAAWMARSLNRFPVPADRTIYVATQHEVTLTQAYWLADSACTQGMWRAVMGSNPSVFGDNPQRPVENVTWEDCQLMVTALNRLLPGAGVRLPTEAEWEHACRAGTTTALYTGDIRYTSYNAAALESIAWYSGNAEYLEGKPAATDIKDSAGNSHRMGTHPVKLKSPNAWGLYDMLGNVDQWCADYAETSTADAVTDPTGKGNGSKRVVRGGNWLEGPAVCRSAARWWLIPHATYSTLGFRLCIPAP